MATRPQTPSERDLELLSAYLDGELNDRERASLEKRLSQDSALRAALDGLRETVALVRSLPRLKAPRNFTLDPAVYGQPVPWWKRLVSLSAALQVSGALGAAASIVIIALAFILSGSSSTSKDTAAVNAPLHAESAQTAVGFVAVTPSSTLTLAPTTSPTAAMPKALTPTGSPVPAADSATDQDGVVAGSAANTAVMPTAESEAAIMVEPAPSMPDESEPPNGMVGQTAEEGAAASQTEVFAVVPGPTMTRTGAQVYDSAEAPAALAPTTTGVPAVVEEFQEPTRNTTTPRPRSTRIPVTASVSPTLTWENREDDGSTTGALMERQSEEQHKENRSTRWLVVGMGAGLFVVSAGLLIIGRRKR
jgi:anti-sigma factor RsiW